MDLGIAGRRAAVAAGSAGLGLASAAALAAEGVSVAICGRHDERIRAAADKIGPRAVPLVQDVSTVDGAYAFVRDATDHLGGPLDILVTNCGGPPPGTFASTDVTLYPNALEANLLSAIAMCKEVIPGMQQRGWGRVVAITSVAVREPQAQLILSNTARAGLTGFLKTVAREVARDGVTVNAVLPGGIATDRIRALYGDGTELAERIPAGRLGSPDELGAAVAFLCSKQAGFITGVNLPIDGATLAGF